MKLVGILSLARVKLWSLIDKGTRKNGMGSIYLRNFTLFVRYRGPVITSNAT